MNIPFIKLGALVMFLGVLLGSFGAHYLRSKLSAYHLEVFKTGVLYQMLHGLGLFVVAWLLTQTGDPKIVYAGIFFLAGILLFSGSLYILSVTQIKWLGAITPLGGLSFLLGWLLILLSKP